MHDEVIDIQIGKDIWTAVEQVFPFAREDREAALAFLLGVACGVVMKERQDREA